MLIKWKSKHKAWLVIHIKILLGDYDKNAIIWALSRENLSSGGCEQHRLRSACAYAQSDQRLCYSRFVKNHI